MQNRLRVIRKSQSRRLVEVAEKAGMTHATLSRLEKGLIHLKAHQIETLARVLGVPPSEIVADAKVPIVGIVGAGSEIYPFDDHAKGQGDGEADCPRGLNPAKTVAVRVAGDSMVGLIDPGSLLFYSRDPEGDFASVVNRTCVVALPDGRKMVKRVRRGPTKGRFNLESVNGPLIEDAELEWASPVRAIVAPALDPRVLN